jgi:acyl carrier protein
MMSPANLEILAFVRRFVAQRTHVPGDEITDEIDFFADGLLDSLGFLDLVMATEQRFAVAIDFADMDIEQFSQLGAFAALVGRSPPAFGEST